MTKPIFLVLILFMSFSIFAQFAIGDSAVCTYDLQFTEWSIWQNSTNPSCSISDLIMQNRTRVEYDANYESCLENMTLVSDLFNLGENITEVEYQNLTCDFCLPNWSLNSEKDRLFFTDNNSCFEQTNLASDLENRPLDLIFDSSDNFTRFYDEKTNQLVLELDFLLEDFSGLKVFSNNSSYSWLIINGLNLSENESFKKTIYLENKLNSGLVCVKDSEISNISEISSFCNGAGEILFNACPMTIGNYSCELTLGAYKISGLKHSAAREQEAFCGEGVCNNGETCNSCSSDCGVCPIQSSRSSGGGGGSSSVVSLNANQTNNSTSVNVNKNTQDNRTFLMAIPEEKSRSNFLTGAVIGNIGKANIFYFALVVIVVLVLILCLLIKSHIAKLKRKKNIKKLKSAHR